MNGKINAFLIAAHDDLKSELKKVKAETYLFAFHHNFDIAVLVISNSMENPKNILETNTT